MKKFERIMRGIQGALIVASTLQIVLGFSGLWRNVASLLVPTVARYASATPLPLPFSAAVSVGSENAGLLALTRVDDRRVVQISAGFMISSPSLENSGQFSLRFRLQSLQLYIVFSLLTLFNDMINVSFSSEAFVVGSLAMFLDCTLQGKDNASRKDRGMHFWEKYRSFKSDARSEEFYSLPFIFNKLFPSV